MSKLGLTRRWEFLVALGLAVLGTLTYWVFRPAHARGVGQGFLALVIRTDHVLELPGIVVAQALGIRRRAHVPPIAWLVTLTVNIGLYYLLALGFRFQGRLWRRKQGLFPSGSSNPETSKLLSRRQLLISARSVVYGGSLAGLAYALVVEPRWFGIQRRIFPIRDLPPALDGLRAVQLADIHHGPWLSLAHVRQVVEATNALRPDLILLTGDYVHQSAAYIAPVVQELARLRARLGIVAVLGNHDWWEDTDLTRVEFARAGIPLIDNQRRILTPDGKLVESAEKGLCVAGVGDLWEDVCDYSAALAGVPPEMPRLLLSHSPDVAEEPQFLKAGYRVDLMISGHTHGGQVHLPYIGSPIVPSRYGQKYAQGLVQGPACPVWICRGIGMSGLPVRLGAPPEITLLELRRMPIKFTKA